MTGRALPIFPSAVVTDLARLIWSRSMAKGMSDFTQVVLE
jgi:hypothetical protein